MFSLSGALVSWLVLGPVVCRVARLGLLVGGVGVPGPGGQPFPQLGDVVMAEPDIGECPVVHPVQPQSGIGEIPAGQARIQAPGKADQLGRAVPLQRRGHVGVIPRLDPASQGAHLPADDVFQVRTGPISITTGWRPRSK